MNFKMPGAVMPDFENRMAVIAKEAYYGPLNILVKWLIIGG